MGGATAGPVGRRARDLPTAGRADPEGGRAPAGARLLATGLEVWPQDVRLRQLLGLALARTGASDRANAILLRLYREGHADEETRGILARTFKDLWAQGGDPAVQEAHLRSACEFYTRAYRLTAERGTPGEKSRWTGINAATTALLLGEKDRAAALAREVRTLCLEELKRPVDAGGDTYWIHATLGEAALILGECAEAEDRYGRAMVEARGRFAYLSSTRRQARLLLRHQGLDGVRLDRCFRIPRVVTFAGHMIDQPGRPIPRFSAGLERAVSDAIAERLEALHAGFGYASAACGSDILFLEAMLERQAEVHVILPYGGEEFVRASVDIIPGAPWAARFERVLARATRVTTATEQRSLGATVTLDYANMLLVGLATIRAQQLGTEPTLLAVWDGRPGDGPGGTATIVRRWRELGHDVEVVDLPGILRSVAPELATPPGAVAAPAPPPAPEASGEFPKHIMAMLFADAVGYSRLAEEEIPRFVRDFLGAVADLVAASPHAPAMKNTWGDALYCVFACVEDAGRFALDLCDRVCRINWPEKGLPDGLNFRIALHAGPVYSCIDPLTRQLNYIGSHVSRAARIEPITPPGQVYASQAFAALAAAQGITAFAFEYIGQIPLAKNAGTFPMYHLRRPVPP